MGWNQKITFGESFCITKEYTQCNMRLCVNRFVHRRACYSSLLFYFTIMCLYQLHFEQMMYCEHPWTTWAHLGATCTGTFFFRNILEKVVRLKAKGTESSVLLSDALFLFLVCHYLSLLQHFSFISNHNDMLIKILLFPGVKFFSSRWKKRMLCKSAWQRPWEKSGCDVNARINRFLILLF